MSSTPKASDRLGLPAGGVRKRIFALTVCCAVLAASFIYYPWSTDGPTVCMFRAVTGLDCPGCGMTRSFCALSHGHVAHAMVFHWLGPLLFAGVLLAVAGLSAELLLRRRLPRFEKLYFSNTVALVLAVLLFAHWGIRLAMHFQAGDLAPRLHASILGHVYRFVFHSLA